MKIIVNGKDEVVEKGATIACLIASKGMSPDTVIVEYNLDLIREESWYDIVLTENDRLEILRILGGG